MRITQEGDYALRVVAYLFRQGIGQRVEAKVISEKENIPLRFLLKLLRKLAAKDIVKSFRGTGGGYSIEKQPEEISVREVIEAIEGPIYVNKCLLDPSLCNLNRADSCSIHNVLADVQSDLLTGLEDLTFDKVLKAH